MRILLGNWPIQTTAAPVPVATGTSLKTMLQVQPSATAIAKIVEWGISFDGFAAAQPGTVELIETNVAATVTAYAAADLNKVNGEALLAGNLSTNLIQVGVGASGYTSNGTEGTITTLRNLDPTVLLPPTAPWVKQFTLGYEPVIQAGQFCRIRVKFGTTVNALCWVVLEI